jgi:IclR family KDG regulon transcriptional repressor
MDNTTKKGFGILEVLASSENSRGVSELARETGLTRSNVQRILQTLCDLGYAEKDDVSSRYHATLRQWEMGVKALLRMPVVRAARAQLLGLRGKTGESSVLCLRQDTDVIYVNKLESETPIRMSCSVGTRLPLHAVATGRVIAAYLPPNERKRIMATLGSTIDRQAFEERLDLIYRRGYEVSEGWFRAGVNSIAAPIWQAGQPVASIAISGPEERLSKERLDAILPDVLDSASRVSEALGHSPAALDEARNTSMFARS